MKTQIPKQIIKFLDKKTYKNSSVEIQKTEKL